VDAVYIMDLLKVCGLTTAAFVNVNHMLKVMTAMILNYVK